MHDGEYQKYLPVKLNPSKISNMKFMMLFKQHATLKTAKKSTYSISVPKNNINQCQIKRDKITKQLTLDYVKLAANSNDYLIPATGDEKPLLDFIIDSTKIPKI